MSGERSLSWDRAQYRKHKPNNVRDYCYIPERSPNRPPSRSYVMESRNYGGDENTSQMVCIPIDDNFDKEDVNEISPEYSMPRPFDLEDLPGEDLDQFEAPSFYELSAHDSFDEVRCILATPPPSPQPAAPTAAEKLESFRAELAEVIQIDDLRKRMAAHIGTAAEDQPQQMVEIDDVRRRMAQVIGETKPETPLCPYKIPPLPEDPHAIPPPPKDPTDIVAIIRRAQAIARLKAIEEAKAPKTAPKKGVRGMTAASKKLVSKKPVPTLPKSTVKPTKLPKLAAPRKPGTVKKKQKEAPATPQHPPDYVPDEWAAAILRTRKLAGLKTTNPKLLPKPKTPVAAPPTIPELTKSPLAPPLPKTPPLPTFANIMERVAKIRSKTDAAKAVLEDRKEKSIITPTQEDLDEFEALEELYGATMKDQYTEVPESVTDLRNRINTLQQQLLQTPPPVEYTSAIAQEELDEFEALEELYGAVSRDQCPVTESMEDDLQHRIDTLQRKLFQTPPSKHSQIYEIPSILRYENLLRSRDAMAAAAHAGLIQRDQMDSIPEYEADSDLQYEMDQTPPQAFTRCPSRIGIPLATPRSTPKRSRSPKAAKEITTSGFDDRILQNIDMPDFDLNDIPEFAFSAEALADAGFEIGDEIPLGEITMPDFDDDISLGELGLEDVTSPDLCDLSISDVDLALQPDYPFEISTDEEEIQKETVDQETLKQSPGFLTSMVNAVVDRFKNMFSPTKTEGVEKDEETELNLDTSLPNMFEITPPIRPKTPPPREPTPVKVEKKPPSPEGPIVIPPHPKDPKDYKAIVKRAQAIQKKKAQEAAMAPLTPVPAKEKKGKREIKSTIPKRAPPPKKKKKEEKPAKVYPPGEYSPSDVKAVARARTLAGIKNRSALLNPELAARIAERKAAKEAELAAIEALPPVERMRRKMADMRKRMGGMLPRPSIEALGTLEAIRAHLPISKPTKPKWRPAGRLRVDRRVKPSERVFTMDFGRVLIPSKRTQKKKGWKKLDVMSPIAEDKTITDDDFMQFSPLKPHEGQKRLQYLKEQAARRVAETIRAAEEAQAAISFQTPPRRQAVSPGRTPQTPEMTTAKFSPIQLLSPASPRTEETRREKVITKMGPSGGTETIREEITETSTIENGEVHTSTRQVTTKTDEYGNITCHIQEGKGLSGEEEALADIEPPEFLDTSDIPPPRDPSIPTPAEIIDRIRMQVQQKLNVALPDIPQSPVPVSPGQIELPEDLTDEELFDIEAPEFERTPPKASPKLKAYTPIEKDQRMYAWGEVPVPTPPPRQPSPPRIPTPKPVIPPPKIPSPKTKEKSPEGVICIPPHPKDPKDYKAMVKRAQAIQKLRKQEEEMLAKTAPPVQKATAVKGRVPISRWVAPPPKDPKRKPRKRLVLKKRVPKVSPKQQIIPKTEEDDDEYPTEPPPLPQEYRDAVARARLIHGLKNRTAALNPKVAAKLAAKKAAEEAAQAAYDALPEYEKIKKRMEKVRKIPPKKRRIEASADILGTIAAIRANMPPIEEVLRQPSPVKQYIPDQTISPRTPRIGYSPRTTPQAPMRIRPKIPTTSPRIADESLEEFEFMEQIMGAQAKTPEICIPVKETTEEESFKMPHISLLQPYISPEQVLSTSKQYATSVTRSRLPSPAGAPKDLSLEEFEKLEAELKPSSPARAPIDLSLEDFEKLEAELRTPSPARAPIDLSLEDFEKLEAELRTPSPARAPIDLSLEDFEKLEAELRPDMSLEIFEALEAEAQKLYDYETPKRGERHLGRKLTHRFTPTTTQPHQQEELPQRTTVIAPSMRMLGQIGYFEEQGLLDEEFILGSESMERPLITPRPDAKPGTLYYDEMQDFRIPPESIVLETSQLMPETPPKNLQERFLRLKEAHEKRITTPAYYQEDDHEPETVAYSPIRLLSPSGAPQYPLDQYEKETSPIPSTIENEWLLNLEESPIKRVAAVKQFRDLEDMPFDELEYEVEPSLADISYEKPISPPPKPTDIIKRIRTQVQQQLKERAEMERAIEPEIIAFPDELPDEELFELSAPSFAKTPPKTPPAKYRSPRVSLPMAWGEVRPVTPATPIPPTPVPPSPPRIPTPVKVTPPPPPPVEEIKESSLPIVIPPHPKDPKDYAAMVKRAQAIHKLKQQEAAMAPPPPPPTVKKGRVPISRWVGPPPKKVSAKPRKKLVMRKRVPQPIPEKKQKDVPQIPTPEEDEEYPTEPPPLPQEYRDAVARARLLHGLKNRTAALNPKIAAKIAAKKAAEEAEAARFNALPEHEKIKERMERLRKKPHRRRGVKPTMEQIAYLEVLKQLGEYQYPSTPKRLSETPRKKVATPQRLSITPGADRRHMPEIDDEMLAEFEELEQYEAPPVCPPTSEQDNLALKERIANLEKQFLETEHFPQTKDISLAEFEALEALEAPPPDEGPLPPVTALDMKHLISNLQQQLLVTPPKIDPRERYKQLLAQRKTPPASPKISPIKTPDIHYSPITLPASPSREEAKKRAEKTTTQITRSGDKTIKEQVIETSEIIDGELQHFTTHVTTTTDPQDELETAEELEDIEEPSFLETTPVTPMERPRPRDLIEKVRKQMKEAYRPEVPTGHLIELRTPPRVLPLPADVPDEELLELSCPAFERTPTRSPTRSPTPTRSPVKSIDVSIPELFVATPPPPTPPLPPVSPLRHRIPSPEGPIVVPPHPKDPTDYKAMVRRARKMQQLIEQNEAALRAEEEAKAAAAALAAIEAAKPKKKERVPISRWTAPPPRKPGKRKKLVMRKRVDPTAVAAAAAATKAKEEEQQEQIQEEEIDYSQPPPLPEYYTQEVARARILAGLKNRTAALNPKVAAREAAKAEALRKVQEEEARLALLNAPPPSPIRDYATAIARMKAFKDKGTVPRAKPSMESAAYLEALKGVMQVQREQPTTDPTERYETPKARYQRIMAERTIVPPIIEESPIKTPSPDEIQYTPLRFASPRLEEDKYDFVANEFNVAAFESLDELEELGEFEEPSLIDVSHYTLGDDQYMPLTPPQTPPPQPSAIISRLRKQYEEQQAAICPTPPATPIALEFPEELPEEELFELSAPSFAKSPIRAETPVRTPDISIPYYFEETPPPKAVTPKAVSPKAVTPKSVSPRRSKSPKMDMGVEEIQATSPPILGICPGVKVKTPQGPIVIPPHPKDANDIAAMIRRAQLIQKLKAKEAAEKEAAAKAAKVRVPISRRVCPPTAAKKGKVMRKLVLKKKAPDAKTKTPKPTSPRECPTEPPQLPPEYIAAVAKARRLAGLKNRTALLAATKAASPLPTAAAKPTPPPPDYASIMERVATLRAAKEKLKQGPTARELTTRQHLINRQQRQERKRLLAQLERLRRERGFDESIEFAAIKTPPPAKERFHAIKSRIQTETPTASQYPYSPVKTPDIADLPQYQPLVLPPTPPYLFLDNVCIPDIADISMQFDDIKDYELDSEDIAAMEDLEFQFAEEEARKCLLDENNNLTEIQARQEALENLQNEYDIAERIYKLKQQLLESPRTANVDALDEYNMAQRMEKLQQQLLKTPTTPQREYENKEYACIDINQLSDEADEINQQDAYDDMMDDFEAMEREYC
ncbi:uncharacterized protein ACRADG_001040 isoform 2-T2 [Cochliomyia hominivorax]